MSYSLPLSPRQQQLLARYQQQLPCSAHPYAQMAAELGCSEAEVLAELRQLDALGALSRVGAVLESRKLGASTLVALQVPPERLDAVAALVSAVAGVNHNYAREHRYNLWFVLTAVSQQELQQSLERIRQQTQLPMLNLPMIRGYHLNLGFPL
ncbi:Lrp/AsnC family transcriptional regulator [Balneatrix alpica]|uniref:Lrp/AsnC family transcriptional regulator n=1 Tax=Balneatrix alpica TaxID=75684 RepID=UPI002739AA7B|nr:Lrp/AsnC family transcriptional regulator [Balneatrix alpica]